jgi:hypothetical protein
MENLKARTYSDIISFAFFCRRASINGIMKKYRLSELQFGIGTVFHFTPTNVPINFAYSLIFSLLSGNPNILRLSDKNFPQYEIILNNLRLLLDSQKFYKLQDFICVIRYRHNSEISKILLSNCSARIIWGGDKAIEELKKIPVPPKLKDLVFGDRFSVALFDSASFVELTESERSLLLSNFYNDTFLFDQNACSSPKILIWVGNDFESSRAQNIFWTNLNILVQKKYEIAPVNIIEKFTDLCLLSKKHKFKVEYANNLLYRISLEANEIKNVDFTNKLGSLFEITSKAIQNLDLFDLPKLQTVAYFGFSKSELTSIFESLNPKGVDRIVPIGSALNMNAFWDGYDIIFELTRFINIE